MISYNLAGSTIECHSFLEHGGGTGIEFPKELLNGNKTKWYAVNKCAEGLFIQSGPYGWVHIKFMKPLIMNGFGLSSANDCPHRDIKNFRLFGKVHKKQEDGENKKEQPELATKLE